MEAAEWIASYQIWLIPLILMLLVFSTFQEQVESIVTGLASFITSNFGGGDATSIATAVMFLIIIIIGVSLALALNNELVSFGSIAKRATVMLILLAVTLAINYQYSIITP